MNRPIVNAKQIICSQEYICWIDIMGTKNTMTESFQKAANFLLKFHCCVLEVLKDEPNVTYYPMMDGIFITSKKHNTIRRVINKIFTSVANIFLSEDQNFHRFLIKGAIAFGYIAHGNSITANVCPSLADKDNYKRSIMFGLPMIQAFKSEHIAPPFGVYIHESARKPQLLQGRYYNWTFLPKTDKKKLFECILSYFDWCSYFNNSLELEPSKIELYKKLTQEYFTDRTQTDSPENEWRTPHCKN